MIRAPAMILPAFMMTFLALTGCVQDDGDGMEDERMWTDKGCETPGCDPISYGPPRDLNDGSYELTVLTIPDTVTAGQEFDVEFEVEKSYVADTDHLAAHYWTESTDDPEGDFGAQAGACAVLSGTVPYTFTTQCTIDEAGTFYLRAHLRLVVDGETWNYFSDEHVVQVVAS